MVRDGERRRGGQARRVRPGVGQGSTQDRRFSASLASGGGGCETRADRERHRDGARRSQGDAVGVEALVRARRGRGKGARADRKSGGSLCVYVGEGRVCAVAVGVGGDASRRRRGRLRHDVARQTDDHTVEEPDGARADEGGAAEGRRAPSLPRHASAGTHRGFSAVRRVVKDEKRRSRQGGGAPRTRDEAQGDERLEGPDRDGGAQGQARVSKGFGDAGRAFGAKGFRVVAALDGEEGGEEPRAGRRGRAPRRGAAAQVLARVGRLAER